MSGIAKNVLCVDRNVPRAKELRDMLREAGYKASAALGLTTGLLVLDEHAEPDVIMLHSDVNRAVLEQLRKENPSLPIIFVRARDPSAERMELLRRLAFVLYSSPAGKEP